MTQELIHQIALTQIPHIGDVLAKRLLEHFGSASNLFQARLHELASIPEVGKFRALQIKQFNNFARVEAEISFITRYQIQPVFYTDAAYPERLRQCHDAPVLLYQKGDAALQAPRMLSVIGTRKPSRHGREVCETLIAGLAPMGITIVSGMAYGVDIIAHQAALANGLPTIGILGHGLDRMYPAIHKDVAREMIQQNGALLTDFISGTQPDKQNFPKRNRIVAGISDATLVIETGLRGGSLITADIAFSYNRDVLAVPGRINDELSAGCHALIRNNKAQLVTGAADIIDALGWDLPTVKSVVQPSLFLTLNHIEKAVVALFNDEAPRHIDEIFRNSTLPNSEVASAVLSLEMQCVIKSLPGQYYTMA
ncbi:DNA processing protein [Chitinophaga costaii]|uniref:DNA processing protein n=1 Tax=Chitinophaga costaii TaxID=1335309 RepID=A0A1C4BX38_9BACT|nr:DNA-processing protein DprA [Chitinophaga costaii]PUZ27439.1 DNA-protecting protein DprA [Chitinophaga costaii]SCC11358.1 DNA processing protein [Chitinophaga costaii]